MSACTCAACDRSFTGLTAFDRHQTTAYGTPQPVTCHDPAARGLVQQPSGRWGFPIDADSRLMLAKMRAERGSVHTPVTPHGAQALSEPHDTTGGTR